MRWFTAIVGTFFLCTAFSLYMYQAVYVPRSTEERQAVVNTPTPPPAAPSKVPVATPEPEETQEPVVKATETPEPEESESFPPIDASPENPTGGQAYYINQGPANIRLQPSKQGTIILVAPNNTSIEKLNKQMQADNYTWEKVRLPYGDEGWVVDKFLGTAQTTVKEETLVDKSTNVKEVNVRELPTTKAKIVKKVPLGTKMKVHKKEILHQTFNWVQVSLEDGQTGWVVTKYLSN